MNVFLGYARYNNIIQHLPVVDDPPCVIQPPEDLDGKIPQSVKAIPKPGISLILQDLMTSKIYLIKFMLLYITDDVSVEKR